jgi:hypothetical protein
MKIRPRVHTPSLCKWNLQTDQLRPLADLMKLAEQNGGFIPDTIAGCYVETTLLEHRWKRNAVVREEQDEMFAGLSIRARTNNLPSPRKLVPKIIYL